MWCEHWSFLCKYRTIFVRPRTLDVTYEDGLFVAVFGASLAKMADILDTPGACQLPLTRIKTIMKSSPEISNISQESLTLIAKATVGLIQRLPVAFM